MSPDETPLPLSTAAEIEQQIRARVAEGLTAANLELIAELTRRKARLTDSTLFDEARGLVARIAKAG